MEVGRQETRLRVEYKIVFSRSHALVLRTQLRYLLIQLFFFFLFCFFGTEDVSSSLGFCDKKYILILFIFFFRKSQKKRRSSRSSSRIIFICRVDIFGFFFLILKQRKATGQLAIAGEHDLSWFREDKDFCFPFLSTVSSYK